MCYLCVTEEEDPVVLALRRLAGDGFEVLSPLVHAVRLAQFHLQHNTNTHFLTKGRVL